jgi:Mrp family chromosome partitioning ATPase
MLLNTRDCPFGTSEMLIGVRVALDACNKRSSTGTSIGITSPRLGEGKTTLAFNLAKCIADGGKRVLLIDADLRSLSLTRALAPLCKRGLPEVLRGGLALTDIEVMPGLGFHILPQPLDRIPKRPPDILSSRQMRDMIEKAKCAFDYVVLDLPAALDHVDAFASADQLDLFVLVAEWGRTTIADLEAVWARCDPIAERMVGIIVNKVPRGSEWR